MSNWRPDGWPEFTDKFRECKTKNAIELIEIGANAMLRALRKSGHRSFSEEDEPITFVEIPDDGGADDKISG